MRTDAAQPHSGVFTPELFGLLRGSCLIGYERRGCPNPSTGALPRSWPSLSGWWFFEWFQDVSTTELLEFAGR